MIPDLSQFQGAVNWDALEAAYRSGEMEAVIMRAGWGSGGRDAQFARNWAEARRRQIKRIAYWFCYPAYTAPEAEAASFNATVGPLQPGEGMAGDFEHDASNWPPAIGSLNWARRFLSLSGGSDYVPGWYAPPSFIREQGLASLADTWWLWVANWFVSQPDTVGQPAGLWQFTDKGNFAGISPVDLSYPLVPVDRLLSGGSAPDMTPDEHRALFDGPDSVLEQVKNIRNQTAEMWAWFRDRARPQDSELTEVRALVGALKTELDQVQQAQQTGGGLQVDLKPLTDKVDALSKHVGVGTP